MAQLNSRPAQFLRGLIHHFVGFSTGFPTFCGEIISGRGRSPGAPASQKTAPLKNYLETGKHSPYPAVHKSSGEQIECMAYETVWAFYIGLIIVDVGFLISFLCREI